MIIIPFMRITSLQLVQKGADFPYEYSSVVEHGNLKRKSYKSLIVCNFTEVYHV